ncbi:hypothetical protein GCM10023307_03220 [Lysobacter hankyongensis]|uniref:Uncharacterized protein n=2 Tax=Lysobacter hankyongensis TaxID=1176535 RepID=A0ABP9AJI4_9GAMM
MHRHATCMPQKAEAGDNDTCDNDDHEPQSAHVEQGERGAGRSVKDAAQPPGHRRQTGKASA